MDVTSHSITLISIIVGLGLTERLLNRHRLRYRSEPRAFIQLAPDPVMDAHFEIKGAHTLYGRCNVLLGDDGKVLARIVEVLRP